MKNLSIDDMSVVWGGRTKTGLGGGDRKCACFRRSLVVVVVRGCENRDASRTLFVARVIRAWGGRNSSGVGFGSVWMK